MLWSSTACWWGLLFEVKHQNLTQPEYPDFGIFRTFLKRVSMLFGFLGRLDPNSVTECGLELSASQLFQKKMFISWSQTNVIAASMQNKSCLKILYIIFEPLGLQSMAMISCHGPFLVEIPMSLAMIATGTGPRSCGNGSREFWTGKAPWFRSHGHELMEFDDGLYREWTWIGIILDWFRMI